MDARNELFSRQQVLRGIKAAVLGAIVLAILFSLNEIHFSRYFPIHTVKLYGAQNTNKAQVKSLLTPLVAQGFFAIEVDKIQQRLRQLPWIEDTFVRRKWPDQIEITLLEKKAIARWNEENLLSEAGEIFKPDYYPNDLPRITGPSGQHVSMLQYFNDINRILSPMHVKISYLELTPYFTWKVKLTNGLALKMGHKDILTRLDQFVKVYPKIIGMHSADVEYVDLRYANGVAVQWKKTFTT